MKKLSNGAVVLQKTVKDSEGYYWVLAKWKGEFVTWACVDGINRKGLAMWGHYFDNLETAMDDFKERNSDGYPIATD